VGDQGENERGGTVLVLLHGWGAPGDDLVPLARRLVRPHTRVIVPAAPLEHPAGGRAWWHLDLARRRRAWAAGQDLSAEVPEGLVQARAHVQKLLHDVRRRLQPRRLVLAGFSQGGMLAMDVALAANPPVDRVVVLSGTLIAQPVWRQRMREAQEAREKTARPLVFLTHGRQDGVLPFAASEQLHAILQQHGYTVRWLPFAGGHEIPEDLLEPMGEFIFGTR
jgi:phospholipase/carboxylesterase